VSNAGDIHKNKEYSFLDMLHRTKYNIFLFFKFKFIYFNWRLITLQYRIGFAIHQHESTMGVHVFYNIKLTKTRRHLS